MNCSICFTEIDERESCNARPINDGRCCRVCDDLIVTPVRVARASTLDIDTAVNQAVTMRKAAERLRSLIVWPTPKKK
jgi:hypothetical protein